jgi:hypothetical protein
MPVDVHEIGTPLYLPVWVTYSRGAATCRDSSHNAEMTGARPGSPGQQDIGSDVAW